ncbi:hydroxymethylglutaryl-CoA lyase [Nocardia speluncae]|uniref:Hydroxymethylglutaryl-CoA lyase n=1 Tax=Nocardia speluncae TaxID=419477 RepID=A0A846XA04_9NOCA|nr:hydroxymethylglutaryl-CoA lyase [Nocardia speluncae]NKY31869.1 hydroxymethylglutaryl-CoA lyase [Nocardia speluncae]
MSIDSRPAPATEPNSEITIIDVSPRDGLQNEKTPVSTDNKLTLINSLITAGIRRIEATSFVHPRLVPQMADAEAVAAALPRGHVSWIGLVLNERGLDRAIAAGLDEVNIVVVATDTFSRKNQGTSTHQGIELWTRLAARARSAGLRTTITIAAAFGCPFEGEVPITRVTELIARCVQAQPDELALADTIGVGVPRQVTELAGAAAAEAPGIPLRWHFHNTRNTGYANALTAAALGPCTLDASVGGIGGCPFAPAATGNIATEDLWYLLDRNGIDTGLDIHPLLDTAKWLDTVLGYRVPGQLARAGLFPAS